MGMLMLYTVMSIPFLLLHKVQITLHQKIALSIIFSLVIITIIFAIVRATITTIHVRQQIDPIWMYLWSNVELNVGKMPPNRKIVESYTDSIQRLLLPASRLIVPSSYVANHLNLFSFVHSTN